MQIKHLHMTLVNITLTGCTLGFINNILSATKYRTSAAGMDLMGETDKLALYLERVPLDP